VTLGSHLTPTELTEHALHRRAVEALIWGLPAVNFDLMLQAMIEVGGAPNQVVYWSRPATWQNQTLTPNPDTIYVTPFFDTSEVGPVVLEIPPAEGGVLVGSIDDCWQTAIDDVGPGGADKGQGGKYLLLPPGYDEEIPTGYIARAPSTYQSFALLRSNYKSTSDEDIAAAVAYGKRVRVYPLSQASSAPETTFIDAYDKPFDATIPYDARFFESLDRIVQAEPWLERDKIMIDPLETIGIVKGKPFAPDSNTRRILDAAACEAHAWLARRWETSNHPYYDDGTHWFLPLTDELRDGLMSNFAKPDSYPIDDRAVLYSIAFFSAKHLGTSQFYLMSNQDASGDALDGAHMYRLRVPPNPPVEQYWSATEYDAETHTLVRETRWSSRSSASTGLAKNDDGSADVFFGPTAPDGQDSNWIPTKPGGTFEVLFRFYGPERSVIDKTWKLPDIEEMR
jgi:hypothetical protein